MSVNRYAPHLLVLPEDDANRNIANGFLKNLALNIRAVQVLNECHGWEDVVETFVATHISPMRQYSRRSIVLLIDFDEDKDRLTYVQERIPKDLESRVFVLGVFSEPEELRGQTGLKFEGIGEALANDCASNTDGLWSHQLLAHNRKELKRMIDSVRPFLFNAE